MILYFRFAALFNFTSEFTIGEMRWVTLKNLKIIHLRNVNLITKTEFILIIVFAFSIDTNASFFYTIIFFFLASYIATNKASETKE